MHLGPRRAALVPAARRGAVGAAPVGRVPRRVRAGAGRLRGAGLRAAQGVAGRWGLEALRDVWWPAFYVVLRRIFSSFDLCKRLPVVGSPVCAAMHRENDISVSPNGSHRTIPTDAFPHVCRSPRLSFSRAGIPLVCLVIGHGSQGFRQT